MAMHKCNKERQLNEMHENISLMQQDILYIRKALEGNGKKGLVDQVAENTRWRYITLGGLIVLSTLCSWMIHLYK